jgi:SAM-dependent methyltransferase
LGDLTESGLDEASFDGVVSGEVLEHLANDRAAVREFHRVLRTGGWCIVTVPAHPELWDRNDEWAGHFRRYTRETLTELFATGGFAVKLCHYWGFPLIRLFHQLMYLPMVNRKVLGQRENISRKRGVTYRVLKDRRLHRFGSWIFSFDNLFNVFPWGIGLFLVARKD